MHYLYDYILVVVVTLKVACLGIVHFFLYHYSHYSKQDFI